MAYLSLRELDSDIILTVLTGYRHPTEDSRMHRQALTKKRPTRIGKTLGFLLTTSLPQPHVDHTF